MDKRKIDQEVYEKYVDASVALFMECYCATLAEDMHQKIENVQTEQTETPKTLDAACRTMIKKECAIRKRKQCVKSVAKGLRYVAGFAIVILALASVLFVSVEAIRVPIVNYYISKNDKYLEFTTQQPEMAAGIKNINAEDPLGMLLSEQYELVSLNKELPDYIWVLYEKSEKENVYFVMCPSESILRIDTENAQTVKELTIHGCKGVFISKGTDKTIAWGYQNNTITFLLSASAMTETELCSIAEQFMQTLD